MQTVYTFDFNDNREGARVTLSVLEVLQYSK